MRLGALLPVLIFYVIVPYVFCFRIELVTRPPVLLFPDFGANRPRLFSLKNELVVVGVTKNETVAVRMSNNRGSDWNDITIFDGNKTCDLVRELGVVKVDAKTIVNYLCSRVGGEFVRYHTFRDNRWEMKEYKYQLPVLVDKSKPFLILFPGTSVSTLLWTNSAGDLVSFSMNLTVIGDTRVIYRSDCVYNWKFSNGATLNNSLLFSGIGEKRPGDTCATNFLNLFFQSKDFGQTWTVREISKIRNSSSTKYFPSIMVDGESNIYSIFAGEETIFKSPDGQTWNSSKIKGNPGFLEPLAFSFAYSPPTLVVYWVNVKNSSISLNLFTSLPRAEFWSPHSEFKIPIDPYGFSNYSVSISPTSDGFHVLWGWNGENGNNNSGIWYVKVIEYKVWERANIWVWVFVLVSSLSIVFFWLISAIREKVEWRGDEETEEEKELVRL